MPQITPTVGRRVWYYPSKLEHLIGGLPFILHGDGPLDAGIAHVNDDGTVNLSVFDSTGAAHARQKVRFIDDDTTQPPTDGSAYAAWMPFQLGQAKAAEPQKATEPTTQWQEPELPAAGAPPATPIPPQATPAPIVPPAQAAQNGLPVVSPLDASAPQDSGSTTE